MVQGAYQLCPPDDPTDGEGGTPSPFDRFPGDGEDLPYKVEVWDPAGEVLEQVVAVSVSPAIGYAAYYAAVREFPGHAIILRHRARVLSRWTGRAH